MSRERMSSSLPRLRYATQCGPVTPEQAGETLASALGFTFARLQLASGNTRLMRSLERKLCTMARQLLSSSEQMRTAALLKIIYEEQEPVLVVWACAQLEHPSQH